MVFFVNGYIFNGLKILILIPESNAECGQILFSSFEGV